MFHAVTVRVIEVSPSDKFWRVFLSYLYLHAYRVRVPVAKNVKLSRSRSFRAKIGRKLFAAGIQPSAS